MPPCSCCSLGNGSRGGLSFFADSLDSFCSHTHWKTSKVSLIRPTLNYKRREAVILQRQFPSCLFAVLVAVGPPVSCSLRAADRLQVASWRRRRLFFLFQYGLWILPSSAKVGDLSVGDEMRQAGECVFASRLIGSWLFDWLTLCVWYCLVGCVVYVLMVISPPSLLLKCLPLFKVYVHEWRCSQSTCQCTACCMQSDAEQ